MPSQLYVANLAYTVTETILRAAFEPHGVVTEARVMYDRETGRSRGFAFVSYEDPAAATAATNALSGSELEGRPIRVSAAQAPGGSAANSGATEARERRFGPDRKAGAFGARYRNRR